MPSGLLNFEAAEQWLGQVQAEKLTLISKALPDDKRAQQAALDGISIGWRECIKHMVMHDIIEREYVKRRPK
jgi:hypothetical protein